MLRSFLTIERFPLGELSYTVARSRLRIISGCNVFAGLMAQLITATRSSDHSAAVLWYDQSAGSTGETPATHRLHAARASDIQGGTGETSASLRMHGARASAASTRHSDTLL